MQIFSFSNLSYEQNKYNFNRSRRLNFAGHTSVFGKNLEAVLSKGYVTPSEEDKLVAYLQKFLGKKLKASRKLGEGIHGVVYKIDDKFCLKIKKDKTPSAEYMEPLNDRKFADLKTYYGECVAKFGDVEILKNVSSDGRHIQVGIPGDVSLRNTADDANCYYETISLPRLASIPQKSFDQVVEDCVKLNKKSEYCKSYGFDYRNPNNFVIVGKQLKITDEIESVYGNFDNCTADLVGVFLNTKLLGCLAVYSKACVKVRQEILKKILLAASKYNLPVGNDLYSNKAVWEYAINTLCDIKTPAVEVIEELKNISRLKTSKVRVKKTLNYFNKIIDK